jgi:hypothetical protein
VDQRTEVETTFEGDEPPAELAALVALATDLAWALRECEPLAEAEVTPGCTPAF